MAKSAALLGIRRLGMCFRGPKPAGIQPAFPLPFDGQYRYRMLGFRRLGQTFDSVANVAAVITPSSRDTANPLITFVPGFDRPVAAFFNSDDTIAYVVNCGAECGGTQASVQQLNLTITRWVPRSQYAAPGRTHVRLASLW